MTLEIDERDRLPADLGDVTARRWELRKELYETLLGIKIEVNKAWAIVELLETTGGAG
jgi:hypothetical protein